MPLESKTDQESQEPSEKPTHNDLQLSDLDWYPPQPDAVLAEPSESRDNQESHQPSNRTVTPSFELEDLDWYHLQRIAGSATTLQPGSDHNKSQKLSEEAAQTELEIAYPDATTPRDTIPVVPSEKKTDHEGQQPILDTPGEQSEEEARREPVTPASLPQGNASLKTYLRIFSYSSRGDVAVLIAAIITSAGSGLAPPIMTIIVSNLVKNFTSFSTPSGQSKDQFSKNIEHNTLIIVYLFIGTFVFSYFSHLCFRVVGVRISSAIRLAYLKALFSQPVETIDSLPPGQTAKAITARANELQLGISEKLGAFLRSTTLILGSAAVAFRFSWSLALVTSSILVFVIVVQAVVLPLVHKRLQHVEHATSQAASIASEAFNAIRMIVASGAEDRVSARHKYWVNEARTYERYLSPLVALQIAPLFIAIYSNAALVFWFGIRQYVQGHIPNIGTIVAVMMLVMGIFTSIGQVIAPIDKMSRASKAAAEFFAVIDAECVPEPSLLKVRLLGEENIALRNVHFAYPSRPHVKILDGFNLTLQAGQITAIVGPSGSGKSTIVALLEKWYSLRTERVQTDPSIQDQTETPAGGLYGPVQSQGHVLIGETDIEDVDTQSWRSQIGLVAQTPFLFNDTIRNNILFGLQGTIWQDSDQETKQKLVDEACKEAFADEFIARLPKGYETRVGESGMQLSGGQRQRLAIARSIIKKPALLILDEATSAMDVQSERIVQAALDRVSKSRTTVVIAHRLSTVKKADKIVVVKSGQVVQEGTHQELLSLENGLYWNLVNKQQLASEEDDPEHEPDAMSISENYEESYYFASTRALVAPEQPVSAKPTPSNELPKTARTFRQLIKNQKGLSLWYLIALLGAGIAGSGLPIQSYILANLVNVFRDPIQKITHDGNRWALYSFILALVVGVGYAGLAYASSEVSAIISQTFRQEYFESILNQRISFWDQEGNSAGAMLAQLTNDPVQLQQLMGLNLAIVLSGIFSIVGCIAISFAFGWKLALLNLGFTLPLTFFAGFFRLRFEQEFERMYASVFAESSKFAAESVIHFRTVASLTLEDTICRKYDELLQWHATRSFHKASYSTVILALSESVSLATQALVFWYGSKLLASGEYGLIGFFVNYLACIQGGEAAGQWLSFLPNIALALAAVNRIFQLRNSRLEQSADEASRDLEPKESGARIVFDNVHFKYPTRDTAVFSGLNLTIENGKTTALVGASGSGKSSIVSLIERFYDIDRGTITWNGTDITTLNLKTYRSAISLVAQESNLIQGTIRQNILIGVNETATTDEALHQACREACIHDFIVSLPNGYSTQIGPNGISLSGGQAQRLSIARALIRSPRILLLDEATSNLDSESESLIQEALRRVRGEGRTMLVVAHRLATVKDADVIYVVEGGRVVEGGSHEGLVGRRGVYWRMCQAQTLQT